MDCEKAACSHSSHSAQLEEYSPTNASALLAPGAAWMRQAPAHDADGVERAGECDVGVGARTQHRTPAARMPPPCVQCPSARTSSIGTGRGRAAVHATRAFPDMDAGRRTTRRG